MREFEILSVARLEYAEALQWYADQSLVAAERFLTEIEAALDNIQRNPESYLRWDDTYHFYLLDAFPYIIAYRYSASLIVVVAIRHTSQDQDAWQRR